MIFSAIDKLLSSVLADWRSLIVADIRKEIKAMNAELQAKVDEVLAAIAAEKTEVKAKLDDLAAQVADLTAKVNAGVDYTEILNSLSSIEAGIKDIYVADVPAIDVPPTEPAPAQ